MGGALSITVRGTTTISYAHIAIDGQRIASVYYSTNASSGGAFYYTRDRLGSVVAVSSAYSSGGASQIVGYRYTPYGDVELTAGTESDALTSELSYTGALKLSEGVLHLGTRDYWPFVRGWLQPDSVDARRYAYVGGDPANAVDPSGRSGASYDDQDSTDGQRPEDDAGQQEEDKPPPLRPEECFQGVCRTVQIPGDGPEVDPPPPDPLPPDVPLDWSRPAALDAKLVGETTRGDRHPKRAAPKASQLPSDFPKHVVVKPGSKRREAGYNGNVYTYMMTDARNNPKDTRYWK